MCILKDSFFWYWTRYTLGLEFHMLNCINPGECSTEAWEGGFFRFCADFGLCSPFYPSIFFGTCTWGKVHGKWLLVSKFWPDGHLIIVVLWNERFVMWLRLLVFVTYRCQLFVPWKYRPINWFFLNWYLLWTAGSRWRSSDRCSLQLWCHQSWGSEDWSFNWAAWGKSSRKSGKRQFPMKIKR